MGHNSYVRARIDHDTKQRAANALKSMGLSLSDVIRILLIRLAEENKLPFELRVPNKETLEAIEELESGGGKKFDSIKALMDDLNEDD